MTDESIDRISNQVSIRINGVTYPVNWDQIPSDISLNTFIREYAQLRATKFMCQEGGCGVCIVTLKSKQFHGREERYWAVNSCLTLLNSCLNYEVITCEGIGNKRIGYHPIQKRLAQMHGSQCGYCTPGFVMGMYSLLCSKGNRLTTEDIEKSFGGNICRCTGYRPILDAMKSFSREEQPLVDIEDLHIDKHYPGERDWLMTTAPFAVIAKYTFKDGNTWYWPKNFVDLFEIFNSFDVNREEFMLVAGNSSHGVYRRSLNIRHFIDITQLECLKEHFISDKQMSLGAGLSLTEVMDIFDEACRIRGFEYSKEVREHFAVLGNISTRNIATLAGNIMLKKLHPEFQSDIYIIFEALNVQLFVQTDAMTQKLFSLDEFLKLKNKKLIITSFQFKSYPIERFTFQTYKIMPRAQNSLGYVNAAILFELEDPKTQGKVVNCRICFAGISQDYTHARDAEDILRGQCYYSPKVLKQVFDALSKSINPDRRKSNSSPEFRRKLVCSLLYKMLLKIAPNEVVKDTYRSGGSNLKREISSGIQKFVTDKEMYPINEPVEKLEGMIQSSGEAMFTNDLLTPDNTLFCEFVTARKVGATIELIDPFEALQSPGVVAFFSAKDIPGVNSFVSPDFGYELEQLFADKKVLYYNQPLGLIVANTKTNAMRAAELVKVTYTHFPTKDLVLTIEDALRSCEKNRLQLITHPSNDYLATSETAHIQQTGHFKMCSQYHFTLESQTCIVIPFEKGLRVFSTTQWLDHTQTAISRLLNVPAADIQLTVRRLGGAFGCKISRCNMVACAAALAAYKLNTPIRFLQTIDSMMRMNGKRWPCRSEYEFHVKRNGKIISISNKYYEGAGCSINENPIECATNRIIKNCYNFSADMYKTEGYAVFTDTPSTAWCRAPGSLEGIAMIENIMEHIAFETKIDPADIRLKHISDNHKIKPIFQKFLTTTEYRQRRANIDKYNEKNRWHKRGLGLTLMEYPVTYMGQFTATVTIYQSDGSVVITHAGIEIGQGINTKCAQVAAYTLKIPLDKIRIEHSDTVNGANSTVTGFSTTSEGVCYAVRKCCETLNERLERSSCPDAEWLEKVKHAWLENGHLTASEQFKASDMEGYSIFGLALTEVEVDILTGRVLVQRVDILQDTGKSLSPHIDLGQIEGAFVMSLGYWLTEKLIYNQLTGELLTDRTWYYYPPGVKDIPVNFRVELLQSNTICQGFMHSKATGEPASCLAVSIIFAIQQALQSARNDCGLEPKWVELGAPTTPETIVLNAGHNVTDFSLS